MKHFIFGYGSLMCSQSRAITAPTLKDSIAEPIVIRHIERTWSARVVRDPPPPPSSTPDLGGKIGGEKQDSDMSRSDVIQVVNRDHIEGWTPMGVRLRRGAKCNGVLIHVDDEELTRFDIREGGYNRHKIDLSDIYHHSENDQDNQHYSPQQSMNNAGNRVEVQCNECRRVFEKASEKRFRIAVGESFDDDSFSDIAVWVYIQSVDLPPNPSFPITQSYVDIIMRGCLSISNDFARKFLQTTQGWWHDGQQPGSDGKEAETINNVSELFIQNNDGSNNIENNDEDNHHTWVNDRHAPMYVRADRQFSFEMGDTIDKLLEEHHPHALKRRVLSM